MEYRGNAEAMENVSPAAVRRAAICIRRATVHLGKRVPSALFAEIQTTDGSSPINVA